MLAAATTGLVGFAAAAISSYTELQKSRAELMAKERGSICTEAFAYLRDEQVNPDLPITARRQLALEQARVARLCLRGEKP